MKQAVQPEDLSIFKEVGDARGCLGAELRALRLLPRSPDALGSAHDGGGLVRWREAQTANGKRRELATR